MTHNRRLCTRATCEIKEKIRPIEGAPSWNAARNNSSTYEFFSRPSSVACHLLLAARVSKAHKKIGPSIHQVGILHLRPPPNSQRLNERLSSVIFSRRNEQLGNSGLRFNRYRIHSRLPRNKSQHKNFWIKSQIDSQLALQSKDRVERSIRRRYKSPADAITGQNKHLFEQEGVGI